MLYEIYFEPAVGVWRIRITTIYLIFAFSRVVKTRANNGDKSVPVEFANYEAAEKFVADTGLARAYRLLERNKGYMSWLFSDGSHGTSAPN